jgi:carbonic anhydrase
VIRLMQQQHFTRILCGVFALIALSAAQKQHANDTWNYSAQFGPNHWGDLSADFATCKTGRHQSPIDIRNPKRADLPPIRFDYKPSPLHIIDNGHTILINYAPGSVMLVGGKKYVLQQFHFHRPSEERVNGKSFEMTVHLVHADEEGHLAVVAVLLQQGADNALVHELWQELPREKGRETRKDNIQIDVSQIVPVDHRYYTFSGSLTTPPCSENIRWFVLEHPATVSAEEIEKFSGLYRNNARPTQPLYNRIVLEGK